jgi:hypothetical protein
VLCRRREANPEATRNIALKTKYGITLLEKDAMLRAQGSVCAICKTDTPTKKGWHVDHCHTTQKVRGVLCHHCNSLLGNARDNPFTLANAITYLGT